MSETYPIFATGRPSGAAPSRGSEAVDRVLIVHPDVRHREQLAEALQRVHHSKVAVRHAASPSEVTRLARQHDPRFVFISLHDDQELTLGVVRRIQRTGRTLVGLFDPLKQNGHLKSDALRRAVRAGFNDFLPLPAADAELTEVLRAAPNESATRPEGDLIAFFGHQGGVGTTTLAVHIACELARQSPSEVVLVDAHLQFGCAAAHLGLAPKQDLAEVARALDEGWFPHLVPSPSGPAVVPSPNDLSDAESISPETLSNLLIELQQRYGHVLVDTAPHLDLLNLAVFDLARRVYVVTEGTAPTLAGTVRLLRTFERLGLEEHRLRLVLNRQRNSADVLSMRQISQQLGRSIDHEIPWVQAVGVATHRGQPVVQERATAPFLDAVRALSESIRRGSPHDTAGLS